MIYPRKTQSAWKLIEALKVHGALSFEEGIRIHRVFGRNRNTTMLVYERAMARGWIHQDGERYRLTSALLDWLVGADNAATKATHTVVLPPYQPPFKPLTSKYMLPRCGPRDAAPLRDGGVRYVAGFEDVPMIRGVKCHAL